MRKYGFSSIKLQEYGVQIWVDADACPVMTKTILFKAAVRTKTPITLIANQYISVPNSPLIRSVQVPPGFDVADNEIVRRMQAGDLVITNDIPLADEVIEKGGDALSPRGDMFTKDNIKARLNMRDFMETMRSSGVQTGGPAAMGDKDKQKFANQLDSWLARNCQKG